MTFICGSQSRSNSSQRFVSGAYGLSCLKTLSRTFRLLMVRLLSSGGRPGGRLRRHARLLVAERTGGSCACSARGFVFARPRPHEADVHGVVRFEGRARDVVIEVAREFHGAPSALFFLEEGERRAEPVLIVARFEVGLVVRAT